MAPTSILADQHYRNMLRLFTSQEDQPASPLNPGEICLLIGDTPDAEKEEIRSGLADGRIKLVIGTHALLEDPVVFANLQLVVVDEQHRFGVAQRAILRAKGENPHLLVMTATPIPSTKIAVTLNRRSLNNSSSPDRTMPICEVTPASKLCTWPRFSAGTTL